MRAAMTKDGHEVIGAIQVRGAHDSHDARMG
jgi:hypothetical protein